MKLQYILSMNVLAEYNIYSKLKSELILENKQNQLIRFITFRVAHTKLTIN